ncbi:hypothetical protein EVG20_g4296 [Dentipellis fragilis]|uniref:Uncharacterized protein n=1 Tax=Dentipellis fragilis TaxID=205917 RepID=A0A4Y9YWV4_9AGAM|nr:hypothetical protein EVG20_g4296 [Dentipellis fragilis]
MASDLDEAVSFSWSDSFRALVAPCLSCLGTSRPAHTLPTHDSSTPHLETLLADARSAHSSSSLTDGETLSLHSSIGDAARRQRRRRGFGLGAAKHISLWGWDLFGKPRGAIRLPEDGDEDSDQQRIRRAPTHSSSTLSSDAISDAAPLDPGAIASHVHTFTAAEEEARAKAERKARRRERKAAKAAALALAQGDRDADAFEGFQGSGSGSGTPQTPFDPMLSPPLTSTGNPLADMQMQSEREREREREDEEMGDFGAAAYVRPRPRASGPARVRADTPTPFSQSQLSSQDGVQYSQHYVSQQPQAGALHPTAPPKLNSKKRRDRKSASSHSSHSHSSSRSYTFSQPTQDSASLASPPAPPSLAIHIEEQASPFEGFPDDLHLGFPARGFMSVENSKADFPSPGLGGSSGFPSTGFGGVKRDAGAFLARRGDDL